MPTNTTAVQRYQNMHPSDRLLCARELGSEYAVQHRETSDDPGFLRAHDSLGFTAAGAYRAEGLEDAVACLQAYRSGHDLCAAALGKPRFTDAVFHDAAAVVLNRSDFDHLSRSQQAEILAAL